MRPLERPPHIYDFDSKVDYETESHASFKYSWSPSPSSLSPKEVKQMTFPKIRWLMENFWPNKGNN